MEVELAGRKEATLIPSAITYADGTAEVSNPRALKTITQDREEMALALRKANELLAANPDDPEAVAKELEREGSIHVRNTTDPLPSEGMMLQLAKEIRRSKDFGAFVKNNEKQAKHYMDHAHPVVEGASRETL